MREPNTCTEKNSRWHSSTCLSSLKATCPGLSFNFRSLHIQVHLSFKHPEKQPHSLICSSWRQAGDNIVALQLPMFVIVLKADRSGWSLVYANIWMSETLVFDLSVQSHAWQFVQNFHKSYRFFHIFIAYRPSQKSLGLSWILNTHCARWQQSAHIHFPTCLELRDCPGI